MNTVSPFILGLISACVALLVGYAVLRALHVPATVVFATLAALIVLTPLPTLVFTGMEHALHAALTLAATFLAARLLASAEVQRDKADYGLLLTLAPLLTAVRFEATFLVLVVCLGFFLRHQWQRGFLVGALGFLPIAAYALVSKLHDWPWFPTSVILKSGFATAGNPQRLVWDLLDRAIHNLIGGTHLVALILLILLLDRMGDAEKGRGWGAERVMTGIFVGTAILHLALARVGWFFRYEAYLVALGVLVVACRCRVLRNILDVSPAPGLRARAGLLHGAATLLLIIALFLSSVRGIVAIQNTPQATANVFDQQYSMAMFIKRYYQRSTVALNDVGAVNYVADIHCLDLWGLATLEVAQLRLRGAYRGEDIGRLAAESEARIALVSDSWFEGMGGLPPTWARVGQWRIRNNVVAGSDTVSIYAVGAGEKESLIQHLAEFSRDLPAGVAESGMYVQSVRSGESLRPE